MFKTTTFFSALALSLLVAGCGASSEPGAGDGRGSDMAPPKTRFDLANRCFALQVLDDGGFVVRDGNGYVASARDLNAAERFYLKPTALGDYLLYGRDQKMLAAANPGALLPGRRALLSADADAGNTSNWTVQMPGAGRYTLELKTGEGALNAADGVLQLAQEQGQFAFVPAEGCTPYPEISTDSVGETYKGNGVNQPVVGFAEVHTHMTMGHEMSDGAEIVGPSAGGVLYGQMYHRFGVPHALEDCAKYHGPQGLRDPEALILDLTPLVMHDTQGWPSFIDWPGNVSQLHQAMYYKWVERAYKAGLRILVSEGTNIEALCNVAKIYMNTVRPVEAAGYECRDMDLGIAQVKYLISLQDYVDAQEGGPGKGWFRIVGSPQEARQVINDGKLAVVPGLEFSNVFRCNTRSVAGLLKQDMCTKEDIDRQIEEVWDLGVREIFPYHDVNSALGGTGIFNDLVINLVGFVGTGSFWDTYDCPDGGEGDQYFYDAGAYMTNVPVAGGLLQKLVGTVSNLLPDLLTGGSNGVSLPVYPTDKRQCNAYGMTELGRYVVEKLMEKKFIIDIDHAELSIKGDMLEMALAQDPPYPMISAHGGHGGISIEQAKDILRTGGLIYPMKPNGKGHVDFMNKIRPLWEEIRPGEPLPLGYGMDANGIADRAGPRGSGSQPVQYPFTLFQGDDWGPQFNGKAPVTFNIQTIPESGKQWHIDEVGTAHYGMVADYVEEIRLEGGKEALDALYNSAEAYIQMWERTVNR